MWPIDQLYIELGMEPKWKYLSVKGNLIAQGIFANFHVQYFLMCVMQVELNFYIACEISVLSYIIN